MYPDYDRQEEYTPRPKRKGNGGVIAMALVVGLVAGVAGGGLTHYFLQRSGANDVTHAPVTLQTVAASSSDGAVLTAVQSPATISEVAAVAIPSVVEVTTESKVTHPFFGSFVTGGAGSGVIITEDGYIATNDHVVSGANSICVQTSDGQLYEARLVGTDPQTDMAVIKIDATGLAAAVFADSDGVTVGELAVAVGNPLGTLGGTVTEGIISARDREIIIGDEAMVLLQTSAAISPGNSGGGLFNGEGQIVGIVNAKSGEENVEGIGFAIPANTAREVAAALIENGYVKGRPMLGVQATTISSYDAMFRYNASRPGIYVTSADADSSLTRGDRMTAIDGTEIASVSEAKMLIDAHGVGDAVEVQIVRGGRNQTVSVTLQERGTDNTLL